MKQRGTWPMPRASAACGMRPGRLTRRCLPEPGAVHEELAVRGQLHPTELRAERCERGDVVEEDRRAVGVDDLLGDPVVDRPRAELRRLEPVVEDPVHPWIGVAAVV